MNVFKKSLFWLLLFVGSYSSFAQELSIRGGLNLSQFNHKAGDLVVHKEGTKLLPGFNFGSTIDFSIGKIWSFETGLLFTSKGHKLATFQLIVYFTRAIEFRSDRAMQLRLAGFANMVFAHKI